MGAVPPLAPAQPEAAEHLVLLVDRPLLQLPLEGLPALRDAAVTSVSRDLSLHVLSNRLRLDEAGKSSPPCSVPASGNQREEERMSHPLDHPR